MATVDFPEVLVMKESASGACFTLGAFKGVKDGYVNFDMAGGEKGFEFKILARRVHTGRCDRCPDRETSKNILSLRNSFLASSGCLVRPDISALAR